MITTPLVIRCPKCGYKVFNSKGTDALASDTLTSAGLKSTCPHCESVITVTMSYEDPNSESPECEKLCQVGEKSQAIGEFVEWLGSGEADDTHLKRCVVLAASGIMSGYYDYTKFPAPYVELPEDEWKEEDELMRFNMPIEKLLAKFFEIDLNKVENERRAILKKLQEANECRDSKSS